MIYDELSLLLDIRQDIDLLIKRHRVGLVIEVNGVSIYLLPNARITMDINKTVGDALSFRLKFVKVDGSEATGIVPDAVPNWSDNNPTVDTLTQSADGLSATGPVIGVGTDAISVDLKVSGVAYGATANVIATAVVPPPPDFDHVEIVSL